MDYPGDDEPLSAYEAVFRAKVTGSALVGSVYRHSFTEVVLDPTNGTYTDPEVARTGTTTIGWLRLASGAQIPTDTIVWAAFAGMIGGAPVFDAVGVAAAAGGAAAFSGASVYSSSDVSVAATFGTVLTCNSETTDTDSYHSTSSNTERLVAPVAGWYQIGARITWQSVTAIDLGVTIINSSSNNHTASVFGPPAATGYQTRQGCSGLSHLTAGQYAWVKLDHTHTSAINARGGYGFNEFWMYLIKAD